MLENLILAVQLSALKLTLSLISIQVANASSFALNAPQPNYLSNPQDIALIEPRAVSGIKNPYSKLISAKAEKYKADPELLTEIIRRESNFDPKVCNKEFGCNAGQGLVQLIPSTVKNCEKRLEIKIDPFNPEDNLECGAFLLGTDGIRHWEDPEGKWGSGPY